MKRVGYLFKEICSQENLFLAHHNARRGKGWYSEVKAVDKNIEGYLNVLR